eukprot:365385-Chlamydomonas_euryale.AAC.3
MAGVGGGVGAAVSGGCDGGCGRWSSGSGGWWLLWRAAVGRMGTKGRVPVLDACQRNAFVLSMTSKRFSSPTLLSVNRLA